MFGIFVARFKTRFYNIKLANLQKGNRMKLVRAAKLFFILTISAILSCSTLKANNPFAINTNQRDFQAAQKNKGKKFFTTENIQVPSNVRELRSVSVTFVNIDGGLETKEIKIDKTLDWHYPLKITQEGAINNIAKRYFSLNDFEFLMEGSTLVISSPKHRLVRHFLLPNPQTIVVDFSRDSGGAYNAKMGMGEKFFSEIGVDSKQSSYRITITLDGVYKYKLKSGKNNTYTINLQ